MTTETELKASRRQIMLRDGLAFLILFAVTAVLFAITLFLFRSFSAHRADLARQFSEEGRIALGQGRPQAAILDLRTALSYAPGQRSYEFLLAQALEDDGRFVEATNYFLNLWESQPGDGFINLQLARLARQRKDRQAAIDYYRASIYGSWSADGVVRRRDVRLELANYLIDQKQFAAAQAELLVASSNAPSIRALNIGLGDGLVRAGDQADALKEYRKAMLEDPHDALAFAKAGRLAYGTGDYTDAKDWLEKALRESAGGLAGAGDPDGDTATLLKNSGRLLTLDPGSSPDRNGRIARILNNRSIAKKRFDVCSQQLATKGTPPSTMQALSSRWAATVPIAKRAALVKDATNEDTLNALTNDTELLTNQVCGSPEGEDAFLLLLAKRNIKQ